MYTWNRAYLKTNAKQSIRKNLMQCVGICLAVSLLSVGFFGVNYDIVTEQPTFYIGLGSFGTVDATISLNILEKVIHPTTLILISVLTLLYQLFIANPIKVGQARFFLENRVEPSRFEAVFYTFKQEWYMNVVKTMFLRELYTFLWTCLFIFPGIYKSYQYYMIPYILAENPDMPSYEVFQLTKEMTQNQKLEIFILNLSFIGWAILCLFACGIGLLFLTPYEEATNVELYVYLRDEAIHQGILEPEYEEVKTESEEENNE